MADPPQPARGADAEMDELDRDMAKMTEVPIRNRVKAIECSLDYGTHTSNIAYILRKEDDTTTVVRLVSIDGDEDIPTIGAYHLGKFYCGHTLKRHVRDELQPQIPAERVVECAKLLLYEGHSQSTANLIERIKSALSGHTIDQFLQDHLTYLLANARTHISPQFPAFVNTANSITQAPLHLRISVPQMWSQGARRRMARAAQLAGATKVEIVSEPQSLLAHYLDNLPADHMECQYKAKESIMVVDMGCGTVDFVVFQLKTDLAVNSELAVVNQKSGMLCGSHTVNEALLDQTRNNINVPVSRNKLNMSLAEFRWHLLQSFEKSKTDPERPKYPGISIFGNNGGHFFHPLTRDDINTAQDGSIDKIMSIMDDIVKKNSPKLIILAGGYAKSTYLTDKLTGKYNTNYTTVLLTRDLPNRGHAMVAKGALSSRRDLITSHGLPSQHSYAMLKDDYLDSYRHRDCYHNNRPVQGKTQVSPWGGDAPTVIDRLHLLLQAGSTTQYRATHRSRLDYHPRTSKPVLENRFVYMTGQGHKHDGPALRDDHDASKNDNPLRDGVYDWIKTKTTLDSGTLQRFGVKKFRDVHGIERWHVKADVIITYRSEQDMTIEFSIIGGDGHSRYKVKAEDIWNANVSEFSKQHGDEDVQMMDVGHEEEDAGDDEDQDGEDQDDEEDGNDDV